MKKYTCQPTAECTRPLYPTGTCKGMQHCFSRALLQKKLVQLFLQHLLEKNRVATNHSSHLHASNTPLPSQAAKHSKTATVMKKS